MANKFSNHTLSDINECLTTMHGCHEDATCTNVIGSFACHCADGFTGDGRECRSKDLESIEFGYSRLLFYISL